MRLNEMGAWVERHASLSPIRDIDRCENGENKKFLIKSLPHESLRCRV